MAKVKRGTAVALPIGVSINGTTIDIETVASGVFSLNGVEKRYPGAVRYDSTSHCFLYPLSQAETYAMHGIQVPGDLLLTLTDGSIIGPDIFSVSLTDTLIREVT